MKAMNPRTLVITPKKGPPEQFEAPKKLVTDKDYLEILPFAEVMHDQPNNEPTK